MRRLQNWLSTYLEYTDNSEPAHLFRTWAGIGVLAASLQRKCWVEWGRKPLYPNLYIALIGPTGSRKGTAMGQALRFIMEPGLNIQLATDSTSRANLIRDFAACSRDFMLPNGNMIPHSSMMVFAPEFTVFLGYNNVQLLTDLIDWYDSEKNPWVHKTLARDAMKITSPLLNILGATTPELLRSAIPPEAIGGGFIARTIFLYAPRREKIVDMEFETAHEAELREQLIADLCEISMLGGPWQISEDCLEFYRQWYRNFRPEDECQDPRFDGYFERKATTLRKLALILSASRSDDKVIGLRDIKLAYALLNEVEQKMYHCLQGVGRNQYASVMNKIMYDLARNKEVSFSDLLYRHRDDVTKFELSKIVESMVSFGFCQEILPTGKISYNEGFRNGTHGSI